MVEFKSVFLSLGSNLGDRELNINRAIESIDSELGKVIEVSPFYESEALGYISANRFINAVVKVQSLKSPTEVLAIIKDIESGQGRIKSKEGYEDRPIDIDILFFGDLVYKSNDLEIPHPRISERLFVLLPLNDIIPGLIHPSIGKTVNEMLFDCDDEQGFIKKMGS